MNCQVVLDRLSPYLDDELDPLASRDLAEHLASCPNCAAALARQQNLRERLRTGLEYHHAPDLLRARLRRDTRAESRREARPRPRATGWRWAALSAAAVVVVAGAWVTLMLPADRANDAIAREAVSNHIRSLMASHLEDVVSTDQHTVKPWFNGKLDFSPPVTDFAAEGFPLVGGRLDYLHGREVAALVYQRRQHVINVFVWPVPEERDALAPAVTQQGFQVIRATHARMALWLVSDLNAKELADFAQLLTTAR